MLTLPGRSRSMFAGKARSRRSPLADVDWVLWGIPMAMIAISGVLIASTQRQADYTDWYQQWITGVVGLGIALVVARMPLQRLQSLRWPIYGLIVVGLLAVRVVGTSALGAQSWINIGGFYLQPSEFAKLGVILLLAGVLERHPVERPVDLARPAALIGLPWLLVFIEPDLGSSLVFGAVLLVMLYWAGMPGQWVVLLLSPLVAAIAAGTVPWLLIGWIPLMGWLAWSSLPWKRVGLALAVGIQSLFAVATPWLWEHGLRPHQRARLTLFLDPSQDPLGGGYHLLQSTVGIGSGQIWGTGLMRGALTKLRFIPEQHTDFIFSALGEETGFIGSVLVVVGFVLLIWRLLQIAGRARTDFESLVVVGIGAMLMFQVVVNINMTIGLGPITGIPLPFLSYGRSAMLMNFMALGLCASVARRGRVGGIGPGGRR